ncbi:MAG: BrnA antitoxin family protein [Candidatus Brocadiales bacterium]|nr:BrnA antitoxin family protein [Candidatus Brocadiales bacterium]
MRKEYDLSKFRFKKNPYAKKLKKQITIRLDSEIIDYFKGIGEDNDVSYQSLINLYLRDCVKNSKKPLTRWVKVS